jgi:hypothetical protein
VEGDVAEDPGAWSDRAYGWRREARLSAPTGPLNRYHGMKGPRRPQVPASHQTDNPRNGKTPAYAHEHPFDAGASERRVWLKPGPPR